MAAVAIYQQAWNGTASYLETWGVPVSPVQSDEVPGGSSKRKRRRPRHFWEDEQKPDLTVPSLPDPQVPSEPIASGKLPPEHDEILDVISAPIVAEARAKLEALQRRRRRRRMIAAAIAAALADDDD